jgi:predicted lipoprotein with Yx(FWY)xxD motif
MIRHRTALALAATLVSALVLTACGTPVDSTSNTGSAAQAPASSASSAAGGSSTATTDMLMAAQTSAMGSIVTDHKGWTLYRYDKDTASPSMSMCTGTCASTWMPVMADSGVPSVKGVDASLVATLTRADGMKQVTLAGWPLYRYMGDTKAGEWKGMGMDGAWYPVTPTGTKAAMMAGSAGSGSASPSMSSMG